MRGLLHEDNINDAYVPFFRSQHRYVNLRGGSGSSKSWTVGQKVLFWLLNPYGHKEKILALRKVGATLRNSIFSQLKSQILLYNLDVTVRASTMSFHAANGNSIVLSGLDDPEKMKSIDGVTKIWMEEATEFTEEDFNELDRRIRGKIDSYYQIILSFNPIHEKHWIKPRFWDLPEDGGRFDQRRMLNIVTTFFDNKFIDQEYKEIMLSIPPDHPDYRIYVQGLWGMEQNDNMWLHAFNSKKHVKPTLPFLPTYEVYLSFDFNKDPLTCLAIQMSPNKGYPDSFINIYKQFGGKKTLRKLCTEIKQSFPNSIFYVTGDRSGSNQGEVGFESEHDSAYSMIKNYLELSDAQLKLNTSNLKYENSRYLMNQMFSLYPNIRISAEGCPDFINDCIIATVDETQSRPHILKKDRVIYKMDYFDAGRYFFQKFFHEFARTNYFNIKNEVRK